MRDNISKIIRSELFTQNVKKEREDGLCEGVGLKATLAKIKLCANDIFRQCARIKCFCEID